MTQDAPANNDDLLRRATASLRDVHVPPGPTPLLVQQTLAAMRDRSSPAGAVSSMRISPGRAWRIAAALVLASGLVGIVLYLSQKTDQPVALLPSTPRMGVIPSQTTRATVIVKDGSNGGVFPPVSHKLPVPPQTAIVVASAVSPGIRGVIYYDGAAPEPQHIDMSIVKECAVRHPQGGLDQRLLVHDGRLENAVISIRVPDSVSYDSKLPDGPVFLDQINCQYEPHVLATMVGQELIVKNSDPFLHNVHALPADNPTFNFGQPTIDFGRKVLALTHPERFEIRCDIHPWMSAWVSVFDHPFFAVSRSDGSFEIPPGLPDGTYSVTASHETLGLQQGLVSIERGVGTISFRFLPLQAHAKPPAIEVASKFDVNERAVHCERCETADR